MCLRFDTCQAWERGAQGLFFFMETETIFFLQLQVLLLTYYKNVRGEKTVSRLFTSAANMPTKSIHFRRGDYCKKWQRQSRFESRSVRERTLFGLPTIGNNNQSTLCVLCTVAFGCHDVVVDSLSEKDRKIVLLHELVRFPCQKDKVTIFCLSSLI